MDDIKKYDKRYNEYLQILTRQKLPSFTRLTVFDKINEENQKSQKDVTKTGGFRRARSQFK